MLVSALTFSSCTKDSAIAPEATVEATALGSSKASTSSSEAREYTSHEVEVELNDIGRENFISSGHSRARLRTAGIYVTDVNNPWDPPLDPIICDGMTYAQLWNDIYQKSSNFLNSPQGQALKAQANATCRPVFYGMSNCGLCVFFMLLPDQRCFDVAQELSYISKIKAPMIEEAP